MVNTMNQSAEHLSDGLRFIHLVHFLLIAIISFTCWVKKGFRFPKYVHVMALIALSIGILSSIMMHDKDNISKILFSLLFPAIVYGVFVLYGGAIDS